MPTGTLALSTFASVAVCACFGRVAGAQPIAYTARNGANTAYCGVPGSGPGATHAFPNPTPIDDVIAVNSPDGPSSASSHLVSMPTAGGITLTQSGAADRSAGGVYATGDARDNWTFTVASPTCFSLSASLDTTSSSGVAFCAFSLSTGNGRFDLVNGPQVQGFSQSLLAPGSWSLQASGIIQPGTYGLTLAGRTEGNNVLTFSGTFSNTFVLALGPCGPVCDSVDFNGDGLFPDTQDIDDFLSVFSGGPCSTGTCGDIDFNNDGLFPDTSDIDSLLSVFSGGPCV